MDIQYFGDSVHSIRYVGDSIVKVTARRYAHAPFPFNQLELVLARLPLRTGYQTALPLYSEGDDSVEVDTVTVLGLTRDAPPRWRVRFVDPVVSVMYLVDSATRRPVGIERWFARANPTRHGFSVLDSGETSFEGSESHPIATLRCPRCGRANQVIDASRHSPAGSTRGPGTSSTSGDARCRCVSQTGRAAG